MSIAALLAGMSAMKDDDDKPTILPEAAIMRLREFAAIYAEFPSFKPGDIVTPRKDGTLRGAGEPNIVLEVAMHATPLFDAGQDGSASQRRRPQVRVARICGDSIACFWVEAHEIEPYRAPDGRAA